jgi:hypothetical protein
VSGLIPHLVFDKSFSFHGRDQLNSHFDMTSCDRYEIKQLHLISLHATKENTDMRIEYAQQALEYGIPSIIGQQ